MATLPTVPQYEFGPAHWREKRIWVEKVARKTVTMVNGPKGRSKPARFKNRSVRHPKSALCVGHPPSCPACTQFVFSTNAQQFGNVSGSKVQFLKGNQQTYLNFVSQPPFFFDGTRSNLRIDYFQCGNPPGSSCQYGHQKVSDFMGTNTTALSQTASRYGKMVTAFAGSGPSKVCSVAAASRSGGGTLNVATLFHEAMHGQSGLMDLSLLQPDLLSLFGLNDLGPSDALSFYLVDNVLGGGAHLCAN